MVVVRAARPLLCARQVQRPVTRALACHASRRADAFMIPKMGTGGALEGEVPLSLKVADPETARHVVHRYMIMVRQNARQGSANTKTRGEVRGGGRKPIKQKGTGNARMGSKRSPLIPGGGVSFGPKPKDWSIKMNKKERRLAMGTALQSAAPDMVAIDDFSFIGPDCKTKQLVQGCAERGVDIMKLHTLIISSDENASLERAGKNVAKLTINKASAVQVYDVLRAEKIVVEEGAFSILSERFQ